LAYRGVDDTLRRIEERSTTTFEPLAALLDEHFGPTDLVCTSIAVPQILPTTRCRMRFDCRTAAQLRVEADRMPRPSGRFVYLLARPASEAAWTQQLAERYPSKKVGSLSWIEIDPAGTW